jgi:hypothetical protein
LELYIYAPYTPLWYGNGQFYVNFYASVEIVDFVVNHNGKSAVKGINSYHVII